MTPRVESSEDARHVAARGGTSARRRARGFVAAAARASAESLDLWVERVSVAAFDFEPDAYVPELASSDDLADHVGDQLPRP